MRWLGVEVDQQNSFRDRTYFLIEGDETSTVGPCLNKLLTSGVNALKFHRT